MKFRNKPVEIEAIRYTVDNALEIAVFCKGVAMRMAGTSG